MRGGQVLVFAGVALERGAGAIVPSAGDCVTDETNRGEAYERGIIHFLARAALGN